MMMSTGGMISMIGATAIILNFNQFD